ncbi:MAG: LysR family transcriptional regulator [Xanthomonadales bacterium]|nr:LysR family transcriptional regulator [Gammaproteobacteria bacterium]MBT8049930.1 LysR family transcriptional regulator [Gammaproteobacteria bacterium]MBT8056424.1 LysR family transcriptional regulator [Gammaproteobacteria bacterium]NNJ78941.1 LysR family transcriptional regulator [Xanthomonadales bacterium]NNL05032.1 LysR family transcriptional regulator [Xanthomonadales bacterium]
MRLRHIEVFHAVYSCGSVTRAAEMLNVSQPSVSKVLAHAEQQLGYRLFDRIKGKLVPTPEADQLFAHVDEVNESLERMRHVAENLRTAETGRIRIAATPAFGIDVLPLAVANYRQQHPSVFFSLETLHHGEICRALLESRIDLGLVFDPGLVPGIASEQLAVGRFFVLTPPDMPFKERDSLGMEDIADHPFISLDRRGPLGRLLSTHFKSRKVTLNTVAHAETYQVAKSLVAHGAGITVADEITARSSGHGDVNMRPLRPELTFSISAVHSETAPLSLLAKDFMVHLGRVVREFID